jgi:hypothetical protein
MLDANSKQYQDLKNYCDDYDFHFFIIKDGKRIEIDPKDLTKISQNK